MTSSKSSEGSFRPEGEQEPSRSLEFDEHLGFEQRNWRVQRVAWGVLALLVLAALLGLFGNGPLSTRRIGAAPLALEYNRFERIQAPGTLRFIVGPGVEQETVELWIARSYLERVVIQRVVPLPVEERAETERMVFTFRIVPRKGPASLLFHTIPGAPGPLDGAAGVGGGPELVFRQFVYP